jgi:hypothetical protein
MNAAYKRTQRLARDLATHVAGITNPEATDADIDEITAAIVTFIESEQWSEGGHPIDRDDDTIVISRDDVTALDTDGNVEWLEQDGETWRGHVVSELKSGELLVRAH